MIRDAIKLLSSRKDLSASQMEEAMQEILAGTTATADIVEFLASLNAKGETVEELTAAVTAMLKYVEPIIVDRPNILDTCGTGGDTKGTFNISTAVSFLASAAGVTVAKHGNRSVSSRSGSADVLEVLGVNINMSREGIKGCLEEIGIAFLYAPNLHPAMKHVMPARRQISGKTMFNILGPLINPARATNQLIGVYSRQWAGVLARVLHNLGTRHALVVHGSDGLDEVTTTAKTFVSEVNTGVFRDFEIAPAEFGFRRADIRDLSAADAAASARIVLAILAGEKGPARDIVLFNAGCAVYAADKAVSIKEGIALAEKALDGGKAMEKLKLLKEYSWKWQKQTS